MHSYINMYENEFTAIIISFDEFIIPAAFPAFKLQVVSTGGFLCLPVFHYRGCGVAMGLQKGGGGDRMSFSFFMKVSKE